jgi:hypothetical protein
MYPLENVYSLKAYKMWREHPDLAADKIDLKHSTSDSDAVLSGPFWEVSTWEELRTAISFLTLMNKRNVLYFRGQGTHHQECLPVLFRDAWSLGNVRFSLNSSLPCQTFAVR